MSLQSITKKNAALSVCQNSLLIAPQLTGAIERRQLVEKASKEKGVNEGGRLMHHARRERLPHWRGGAIYTERAF